MGVLTIFAYYKVSKHIMIVEEFPLRVTGKIQKFVMLDKTISDLKTGDSES